MIKKKGLSVKWKWLVLWSLWAMRLVRQPTPTLVVSSGYLRGSVSPDGTHLHYLGIPYANVERRFQDAVENPKWNGVFEAIDENVYCHQMLMGRVTGQEDCLVINIYTPIDVTPDRPLPVMVFIHGGGFYYGSGSRFLYGPEYLVAKKIILVTFNYRLGVLGFACLGIEEAPGNAGLKDQVAALKWVQRNIRVFGGDPDNVTIFGESAGAASVSFHMISPASKGLFHKAIMQSGTAIAPWGIQPDPINTASRLANALGHESNDNPYSLYDIFENKTIDELYAAVVPRPEGDTWLSEILFVPCVEKTLESGTQFLTDLPYNIFLSGDYNKVPTIIGTNSEEGYFLASMENSTVLPMIRFDKALPKDLLFPSEEKRKEISQVLKSKYVGDQEIPQNILGFSRYVGDMSFVYPAAEQTELILNSSNQPVYSYNLNYNGWRNFAKLTVAFSFAIEPGASHADDLMFLFKPCMAPSMFEDIMIDIMTTYWTNFAKYGALNPTEWSPANKIDPQSLILGTMQMKPLWYPPSLLYWKELYQTYRRNYISYRYTCF